MKKTRLTPSSFLAWLEAGVELTANELARLVGKKHPQTPASHLLLEALAQRGEEIDRELRHALSPAGVTAAIQKMMYTNPVYKSMSGSERNYREREQQLDLLSGKVDLLIAQVALLNASPCQRLREEKNVIGQRSATANMHTKVSNQSAVADVKPSKKHSAQKPADPPVATQTRTGSGSDKP